MIYTETIIKAAFNEIVKWRKEQVNNPKHFGDSSSSSCDSLQLLQQITVLHICFLTSAVGSAFHNFFQESLTSPVPPPHHLWRHRWNQLLLAHLNDLSVWLSEKLLSVFRSSSPRLTTSSCFLQADLREHFDQMWRELVDSTWRQKPFQVLSPISAGSDQKIHQRWSCRQECSGGRKTAGGAGPNGTGGSF